MVLKNIVPFSESSFLKDTDMKALCKHQEEQSVTYNLKFNGLSVQFYGSYFEVHADSANVTFCVCIILQTETLKN